MYSDHYGLSGRPFQLTPDPRFYFDSATHRKAMAYLGYGLAQGEGFIVITGDIGTGKTTLVGHLMATIDTARLTAIKIVSTQIEGDDMLRMSAQGMGIASETLEKAQILDRIERYLIGQAQSGKRTLLIVDEAQNLPISALEELRMLSNFQVGGQALLQIFLLGQPEFRTKLSGTERLEQLCQRVIATHHLSPMGDAEIAPYITHRLKLVGWQGNPQFTDAAFAAMFAHSDGVPRRLNALASRIMLYGAIEHLAVIDGHDVVAVIADMDGETPQAIAVPQPLTMPEPVFALDPDFVPEPVSFEMPEPLVQPEPQMPREPQEWQEPMYLREPVLETTPEPELEPEPEPEPEIQDKYEPVSAYAAFEARWPELESEMQSTVFDRPAEPVPAVPIRTLHMVHSEESYAPLVLEAPVDENIPDFGAPEAPRAAIDESLLARIALLEARLEEQESMLRRVLTLLVDWVEGEQDLPDLERIRGVA